MKTKFLIVSLFMFGLTGCDLNNLITTFNNPLPKPSAGPTNPSAPVASDGLTYQISLSGVFNNATINSPLVIPVTVSGGLAPYTVSLNSQINSVITNADSIAHIVVVDKDQTESNPNNLTLSNLAFNWSTGNNTTGSDVSDVVTITDANGVSLPINLNISRDFTLSGTLTSVGSGSNNVVAKVWGGQLPYSVQITSSDATQSTVSVEMVDSLGDGQIVFNAGSEGTEVITITDAVGDSKQLTVVIPTFHLCPLDATCPVYWVQ
jgi:hypothetical protein